jgi:hypothetical protein
MNSTILLGWADAVKVFFYDTVFDDLGRVWGAGMSGRKGLSFEEA